MTLTIGETATLAHGLTMADVHEAARSAVFTYRGSYAVLDASDRYDYAWHAVVELIYTTTERPSRWSMIDAGRSAISAAVNDSLHHHGYNRQIFDNGPRFSQYWLPVAGPGGDFTDTVTERMALPQVLARLSPKEYQALAALATCGNQVDAARLLGISKSSFDWRLGEARRKVIRVWFEHETPRVPFRGDPERYCRAGHLRADHTTSVGGQDQCGLCNRNSHRRRRAKGDG